MRFKPPFTPRVPPSSGIRKLWILGLLLGLAFQTAPARGVVATQVADLLEEGGNFGSSNPTDFTPVGDRIVFFAQSEFGPRIWSTDGTSEGTFPLPEPDGILFVSGSFVAKDDHRAYWIASEGNSDDFVLRFSLWATDGTIHGTGPLAEDLATETIDGPHFSFDSIRFGEGIVFGGELRGRPLWRSDGTPQGTVPISTNAEPGQLARATEFQRLGDEIYFLGFDTQLRPSLWRTDGSSEGTVRVQELSDIAAGFLRLDSTATGLVLVVRDSRGGSAPHTLYALGADGGQRIPVAPEGEGVVVVGPNTGENLYFVRASSETGSDLWRTDGTGAPPQRMTRLPEGTRVSTSRDGAEFLEASNLLMTTRGSAVQLRRILDASGATEVLHNPCDGSASCPSRSRDFQEFRDSVTYLVNDATRGLELWISDGTPSGTHPLRRNCSGRCEPLGVFDPAATPGEDLFFIAEGPGGLRDLWRTDGTLEGTERITDLRIGSRGSAVFFKDSIGELPDGELIFVVNSTPVGLEPWISDSSEKGARLLYDIARSPPSSAPSALSPLGDRLTFVAQSRFPQAPRLMTVSSPAEPAPEVEDIAEISEAVFPPKTVDDHVYFPIGSITDGFGLWRTDGSREGTRRVLDVAPGVRLRRNQVDGFVAFGDRVFFSIASGNDLGIWSTDGSAEGTRRELPGFSSESHRFVGGLHEAGDRLYFEAETETGERELWTSDGTGGGTFPLASLDGFGPISGFRSTADGTFFWVCSEDSYFISLWRTDGTEEGTERLPLGRPNECRPTTPEEPIAFFEGRYYFLGAHADDSNERFFWRTDGTEEGSEAILPAPIAFDGQFPTLEAAQGQIFLTLGDPEHGVELWASDGTREGTFLVLDLLPGLGSSHPGELTAVDGRVFFAASNGTHGRELWVSDGTAEGTRMIHDINPGAESSSPSSMTRVGNRLFFTAEDGLTGRELWALPLDASGPPCRATQQALCLQGNRFRVEARWRDFQDRSGAGKAAPLTADTGYFWFFDPENAEVITKLLDGRRNNGHFWSFYGALSNVEYFLTVTDTESGLSRRYFNPSRNFASVGDTRSFGPLGANHGSVPAPLEAQSSVPPTILETSDTALESCTPSATRLCLNQGRFAVEARWADFRGNEGTGTPIPLTGDTGYFWFFNPGNIEVVLKVLDGRGANGNFWVFYGSLSNVDFDLILTDTQTGLVRTYLNRGRSFASVGDTEAFPGEIQ